MNHILIALDFSEFSPEVEKVGFALAKKIGASVTLVTIVNKFIEYDKNIFCHFCYCMQSHRLRIRYFSVIHCKKDEIVADDEIIETTIVNESQP